MADRYKENMHTDGGGFMTFNNTCVSMNAVGAMSISAFEWVTDAAAEYGGRWEVFE
jgi:hypothetical protein